jgi:hypothetical protein
MNWRLFFVGIMILVGFAFNGFLLYNEEIVSPDARTKADERAQDKLFGMHFTAPEREANIVSLGFDPDEVKDILKRIGTLEEKYKVKDPQLNQVAVKIEGAEDQDALAAAFCGTGSTLPVRYAAMPFLLQDKDGQLKAVDVEEISSFQYANWAKTSRIQTAYDEADRTKDRKEDAPRMVLAALLARDEETLITHKSPWGRGVAFSGWSWADVQKKHPGLKLRLSDYVALMHLVLETANAEGGLCST